MKKLFTLLTALAIMMLSATAFAANEQEALADGADITGIRRMAMAEPLYNQMKDGPSLADVTQAVYDASALTKVYVISYGDIASNIKRDTDVDIRPLNHRQAMKVFRLCVPKYVDAYVVPTIANNNRKTVFFDVYQVKTDALLYRYQLTADKNAEDSYMTYKALSEQFFKKFDRAIENQKRRKAIEAEKKAKLDALLADPVKRAEYEKKSEEDKKKAENKKVVIFTAYSDTAKFLFDELKARGFTRLAYASGQSVGSTGHHSTRDFTEVLESFAPYSKLYKEKDWTNLYEDAKLNRSDYYDDERQRWNVDYEKWQQLVYEYDRRTADKIDDGIDILIATDCLSEGQNLQDADMQINL